MQVQTPADKLLIADLQWQQQQKTNFKDILYVLGK